ncbi:MAG TPA: DUF5684 domain-containing protein [Candidatus Saccharimonadales bacterium]|nr:DUF5684 domain-containing protein [Candidatus Saccharimonadales bacterium]
MNISLLGATDFVTSDPTTTTGGGMSATTTVIWLAVTLLLLAGFWKTFQKAGRHGWASIVPIYNIYTVVKIAGRSGWWVILYFIPLVNIIVHLVVSLDVAKAFGKSGAFGVFGLWLFSFVGYPILGFGDAKYTAPTS